MGFIKDVKAATISKSAERAWHEGHSVFLCRINVGSTDPYMTGPVSGFAEQIEAVEAVGWVMDKMDFVTDKHHHHQGYFLFRRPR